VSTCFESVSSLLMSKFPKVYKVPPPPQECTDPFLTLRDPLECCLQFQSLSAFASSADCIAELPMTRAAIFKSWRTPSDSSLLLQYPYIL